MSVRPFQLLLNSLTVYHKPGQKPYLYLSFFISFTGILQFKLKQGERPLFLDLIYAVVGRCLVARF